MFLQKIKYELEMMSTLVYLLGLLLLNSYILDLSILTIGGVLLIFGSVYVYMGNVYFSIINYTLADMCWLYNAYSNHDVIGTVSVSIGIKHILYQ